MDIKKFLDHLESSGLSKNQPDDKYDEKELKMGIEIEKEHTDIKDIAKKIAKDHLEEIPDYYTRLRKMELDAEKDLKKETEDE